MKIREKKYLFEGFLNVLFTALISLILGVMLGTWIGVMAGVAVHVQDSIDLCMKYPMYPIEECNFAK